MRRLSSQLALAVLALALLAGLLAARPAAAQAQRETITAQLSLTLLSGSKLSGVVVVQRTLGPVIRSSWTFSGLLNGLPLQASGEAIERWPGSGRIEISLTRLTTLSLNGSPLALNPDGSVALPPGLPSFLVIEDRGNGVALVLGVPLAVTPAIQQPGSGNQSYIVTNAGQGPGQVTALPNTAERIAGRPAAWPALAGLALAGLGLALAAARRRAAPR